MTDITIQTKDKLAGYFRLEVRDTITGEVKKDTGWFRNLIVNEGLDFIGAPPSTIYYNNIVYTHCSVGTGNTAPAYTDTQLSSFLAVYPTVFSSPVQAFSTSSYVPGPPAYWSGIKTFTFDIGAVVGNIAEVGVGVMTSTDTQPQLFSRSLIIVGGVPGTISLTSTDALTVFYELRIYLDLTDNSYSFNIETDTYSGIYRRSLVTTVPKFYNTPQFNAAASGNKGAITWLYNGTISSVTGKPSGTELGGAGASTNTYASYIPGSSYINVTSGYSVSQGNLTGGITAMRLESSHGSYQFSVSPAIPKTSSFSFTLYWQVSWARYP